MNGAHTYLKVPQLSAKSRPAEASITLDSGGQAVGELPWDGQKRVYTRIKEGSQKVQTEKWAKNQIQERALCDRINPKVKSEESKERLLKKLWYMSKKEVQESR